MQSHINAEDVSSGEGQGPFVDGYLLYLLAQASTAASAAFHAQLAEKGVSVPTWRILASLYPDRAMNVGDLARACLAKQPTLTRQLDRLCAERLTLRVHEDRDRRAVLVSLTDRGREQASALIQMAREHERQVLRDYEPAEAEALKAALRDLTRRAFGD